MGSGTPVISKVGGRRTIMALGVLYVVLAVGWGLIQTIDGDPLQNVLLVSLFVAIPGFGLFWGGYRLPRTDIDPEFYPVIGRWCLGTIGIMFGILAIYHVQPADSLNNPDRSILILSALSSVAGFSVGSHDARAKTRAREVARRNQELRKTRTQLSESNERLEQFAYAASHDLEEPLRMITSYLRLLERRYGDDLDEDGEEFIEYAVDGAERMKEMIDALLEYSRIETRGEPLEPVDLEEVLGTVLKNLELRIDERNATVELGKLPRVMGDRRQLRHVFQNLLSNAIEYTDDKPPHVRVSVQPTGSKWRVSVSDNGIGVPSDKHEAIFDVFQRLHTHEEHAGTGIGLALCKRIVERHGGEIWVDSEYNEGATFSLTLPAVAADQDDSRDGSA
ncbi:sensor histidine kinase [Halostagnicola bangensis]